MFKAVVGLQSDAKFRRLPVHELNNEYQPAHHREVNPCRQRLRPFPLRSVPLAHNCPRGTLDFLRSLESATLQRPETLPHPAADTSQRLNRFAELRRFKLPLKTTVRTRRNPATRKLLSCFLLPSRPPGSCSAERTLSLSVEGWCVQPQRARRWKSGSLT